MKRTFFSIFLVFFICYNSKILYAVSIDSVTINGDNTSITVNGQDFGAHDLDIKWLGGEDGLIESSAEGSVPINAGGWRFDNSAGYPAIVSSEQAHSGLKSLYHHTDSSHYNSALRLDLGRNIQPKGHLYATWWVRFSYSTGGQWKMFRVNYENNIEDDAPQFVMFNWTTQSKQLIIRPGPGIFDNTVTDWSPLFPSMVNRWYRVEIDVSLSDVGINNGSYTMSLYDPDSNTKVRTEITNSMSYSSALKLYRWLIWQNYSGNGMTGFEAWTDDHYVQFTPARVELCDIDYWENRQHCEVQYPVAWSDSEIVISFNQGSFNVGDTCFLYVIDADGNVSNNGQGVQITIGEGGGIGTPSDQAPSVSFTAPTTSSSYALETARASEIVTIEGTAADDKAVQSVTYSTDKGQSGSASSADGFATWSVPVTVNKNETVVTTVTVTDDAGQRTSKTMSITCTCPVAWDATVQAGDSTWTDSGVTYCVRLLVEGNSITDSAGQVVLGFQGRSSGDYTIRNVSIAQRDPSGSEGDVIDSTWQQVTFDNAAWNTSVTVPAGTEKTSDPVTLSLQPGADYYVTFKIDTPSVYLDPPAGYRELYFASADHTGDVDWSGTGFSVTQDYHALAKIYVYTPAGTLAPPAAFELAQ